MIAELVGIESPTEDRAGVNRCVALVERWIKASGGQSQRSRQGTFGDLLVGRFGPARSTVKPAVKPLMLLGHLDTVWPLSTLKKMPFRVRQGRAWGPGGSGHEGRGGDGPGRPAHAAGRGAADQAGVAFAQ